jgi:transposase
MTVAITHPDLSAADLRQAAGRTQDANVARRMLAIALVLEGCSRTEAAETCAMDRQTLRDWVHRYNASGLDGLSDQPRRNGPLPRLSAEQQTEVEAWVDEGADLKRDGVVRWRRVDLQQRIEKTFGVSLHERTVGKLLHKLSFRRLSVRPQHPKSDPEAQASFQAEFPALVTAALPPEAAGKPVEIWFGDEARVGQQGTLTRVWARLTKGSVERCSTERSDEGKRGTRPRALRDRRFQSAYLFGAVCPERKTGAAVVMPEVGIEAMNEHLAAISQNVGVGAIAVLVLDKAGWHTSARLTLPNNIVLLPLLPYAPELNPAENIWEYMRKNWFGHQVWPSYKVVVDACCEAWNKLMQMPERIASLTQRDWAAITVSG